MSQKHAFVILVLAAIIISVASASAFTETRNGRQYTTSLEGGGIINPTLSFNATDGYLVPDYPNNTYTVYGTVESYDTQDWEDGTGGAITLMIDNNSQILTSSPIVFKQWYQAGINVGVQTMGYAESTNGINWTKYPLNPMQGIGNGVAGGSVIKHNGIYYMFLTHQSGMNVLQSANGISWSSLATDIITKNSTWGASTMWYQYVWVEGSTWYMLYSECPANNQWAIGLATASQPQGPWSEYSKNPVVTRPGGFVGLPEYVYKDSKGYYWLWTGIGDTPSGPMIKSDVGRYRTNEPNNLTAWSQNPATPIYVGSGITETAGNAYRQEGFGIPSVRYNNLTYIFGDYAVENYQNNYVGDTHMGVITTELTLDQIITTNQQYPDMKGVVGI